MRRKGNKKGIFRISSLAEWDWKSYTAAILGSGLVVFTVTTLYSSLINKPNIDIGISENNTIKVTNKGLAPATNLILTIHTNGQITNPPIFSSENITATTGDNTASITQLNPQILQIQSSRLASGQGSTITINLPNSNTNNLIVYATYDQGSVRKPPPMIGPYDAYLSASPIIIPSIGAIISFIYLIERRSKNDMLRFMAAKIFRDVREVTTTLEGHPFNVQELLEDHRRDGRGMYSNKIWANPKFEDMKVKFFIKEDLEKLYKFFTLLLERESVIKNSSLAAPLGQQNRSQIFDANDNLNRAAQSAYKDINWEKYTGFKFIKFMVLENVDSRMTVKFRMLFTVKDRRYALYQIISIGLIVVIVIYPALYSIAYSFPMGYEIFASIVYILTGGFLLLALSIWWRIIDRTELKRSVFEEFEIEREKLRVQIAERKKDKDEDIEGYRDEARKELDKLQEQLLLMKDRLDK